MTLPTSRNTNYAPESPVRSADLNDMQDCIVGRKHADSVRTFGSLSAALINPSDWNPTSNGLSSLGGDTALLSIPFDAGDRLKSVTFALNGDGTAGISINVQLRDSTGNGTDLGPGGASLVLTPPLGWSDNVFNIDDTVIPSNGVLLVMFTTTAAGIIIGPTRVTYDHP